MKLIAACFLLMLTLTARSQTIPRGADRIEIKTTLPDSVAFEELIGALQTDGWVRKETDEKRKQIVTDNKPIKLSTWAIRLLCSVRQGVVTLRSQASIDVMNVKIENEPVFYKGMGGAMHKVAFNRMDAFAKQLSNALPGSTINYLAP